ncbi:hypothetical protein FJY94_05755 [Candidatus Kaiserbacteria bacterium]|nr:hypothetical protein [Candidatus Kaiserbacteria bacterium]
MNRSTIFFGIGTVVVLLVGAIVTMYVKAPTAARPSSHNEMSEDVARQEQLRREVVLARTLDRDTARRLFGVAHGHAAHKDLLEQGRLLFGPVDEHQERACVTYGEEAHPQCAGPDAPPRDARQEVTA